MRSILLRCYPARWRARYGEEFLALLEERPLRPRDIADVLLGAFDAHRRSRVAPSAWIRTLGVIGVAGGVVLLAAFAIGIPNDLNIVRLILYFLGSIAVIVGVHRRQASRAKRMSATAAAVAILANIWYPVMLLVSIGKPIRHDEFGLVFFYAALAWWLADAAFGFVALRLGAVSRWGALALGVGSLLAILGIGQLELTSPTNPTIFGPIALIGVALNGVAWILLGLDVMLGGSPVPRLRSALAR